MHEKVINYWPWKHINILKKILKEMNTVDFTKWHIQGVGLRFCGASLNKLRHINWKKGRDLEIF